MRFEAGAEIARQRAGGRCEVGAAGCTGRGEQTHHRQPRGMGGVSGVGLAVNLPSGLLRVCLACHALAESRRDWARQRGLLVPRPAIPAEVPVYLRTVYGAGWYLLTDEGDYAFAAPTCDNDGGARTDCNRAGS